MIALCESWLDRLRDCLDVILVLAKFELLKCNAKGTCVRIRIGTHRFSCHDPHHERPVRRT